MRILVVDETSPEDFKKFCEDLEFDETTMVRDYIDDKGKELERTY